MDRKNEKTDSPRPVFKSKRKEKGSQRFVGSELGLAENYVRHLENGYATPSLDVAFKIGKYLDATVYELFPDLADPKQSE